MERKLATIAKILDIQPISNADAIEVAIIRGWKVVVKQGDFRTGDLCVYCEIDSLMPKRPEFEFLAPRGYRIKTVKLRGQVSQGIAFPLSILPEPTGMGEGTEGMDVTDLIGVTKYEPPIPAQLRGLVKGPFPGFLHKTDEERVQNLPWVFERYPDTEFYVTEKLNGASMTCYLKDDVFGVCSRNLDLKETDDNAFWQAAHRMKIEEKMRGIHLREMNYALQGELVGEGVQKNMYKLKGTNIMFFNGYNIDQARYLSYGNFTSLLALMGLPMVPVVEGSYLLPKTMEEVLAYADGKSLLDPKKNREGIVVRSIMEGNDPDIKSGRISFKVVSNRYLLKDEE